MRFALIFALLILAASPIRGDGVEEITVTAERRPRSLDETPVSVVVLDASELIGAGVDGSFELTGRVPGFWLSTNSVLGEPYLRGVGSEILSAGGDASVATFVDGVYRPRAVGALQEFFDTEAVEVSKGPQGVLFGRNATGGAIRIETRDPEPHLSAGARLLGGNYRAFRGEGFVNVPLVEGAALRIAGVASQRDGFTRNRQNDQSLENRDLEAVRAKLALAPSDPLRLLLAVDYTHDSSLRGATLKLEPPLETAPGFVLGGTVPRDPRRVRFDLRQEQDVEQWGASLEAGWSTASFGLTSISAYRDSRFRVALDLDGTESPFSTNRSHEVSRAFSQEFQLSSVGSSSIEWLLGAYYLHEDAKQSLDVAFGGGTPQMLFDQPSADVETDAVGVFAEVGLRPFETLRMAAGLRYSYEDRALVFDERLDGVLVQAFRLSRSWDGLMPRVVVEWTPREALLAYATVSRGFKSGGFNTTVAQTFPFRPESLWSYEAGLRWVGKPSGLRLRLGGFYYDYRDMQLQVITPGSALPLPLVRNAGHAELYGVELEFAWQVLPALSLEFGGAWLEAEFEDLVAVNPNALTDDPDLAGNRLPRAPRLSLFGALEYTIPVGSFGIVAARVDGRAQSQIFFDEFESDTNNQESFGTVNARLSWALPDESARLSVFGRNLTDTLYAQSGLRIDNQLGQAFFWGAPLTVGAELELAYH